MHTLTPDLFHRLAGIEDDAVLSIHIPTHRGGQRTEESRIHFKNGLDEARQMLEERDIGAEEVGRRLEPLHDLTNDHKYWQHQREGLSVFQYRDQHVEVSSEQHLRPLVQVGHRPHLSPLVEQIGCLQPYSVLALSSNRVALYRFEGDMMKKEDVPGLMEDYEDLGRFIDAEKQLQVHSTQTRAGGASGSEAVFHGHGSGSESDRKVRLREFSNLIDKAVARYLRNTTRDPLIVLGAEPLHSIYREANTYDNLMITRPSGNTDHFSTKQIREAAKSHMDSVLNDRIAAALVDMAERLGSDGVLFDLDSILNAAKDGRLERVIGASDHQVWGVAELDRASRHIRIHEDRQPGDEDLHNLAMVTAHQTGAELFALPEQSMPDHRPLLGLRRF